MPEDKFFKEVEKFYLEKKGFGSQLSAKEREIIQNWFKEKIKLKTIKNIITEELNRLPISKRKKFSLVSVDQRIKQHKKSTIKKQTKEKISLTSKWEKFIKLNNLPEHLIQTKDEDKDFAIQNNIINYLWKKMTEEEKKEIFKKAKSRVNSNINLTKDEYEKAIKSQIRKEIKNLYNIPD